MLITSDENSHPYIAFSITIKGWRWCWRRTAAECATAVTHGQVRGADPPEQLARLLLRLVRLAPMPADPLRVRKWHRQASDCRESRHRPTHTATTAAQPPAAASCCVAGRRLVCVGQVPPHVPRRAAERRAGRGPHRLRSRCAALHRTPWAPLGPIGTPPMGCSTRVELPRVRPQKRLRARAPRAPRRQRQPSRAAARLARIPRLWDPTCVRAMIIALTLCAMISDFVCRRASRSLFFFSLSLAQCISRSSPVLLSA